MRQLQSKRRQLTLVALIAAAMPAPQVLSVAALYMAAKAEKCTFKDTKEGKPWYTTQCSLEQLQGKVVIVSRCSAHK
jgi:hypothetical protein